MTYKDIITLLCPAQTPEDEGYLWAKFNIKGVIPDCREVYYCANDETAAQLLVNQIKPTIVPNTGYFVVFPISDTVDIGGSRTDMQTSFSVTHFGWYDNYQSEAIARTHVTQLMTWYRSTQQRYISNIRINNTSFHQWSDDNSDLQQYTTVVSVKAVTPYTLAPNCI